MFGLPSPYLAVGAMLAMLGAFVGGYLKGGADTGARWEAATAKLQAQAATTLAEATARAREADNANAALARTIEENHAKTLADNATAGADFDRRLRLATSRERSRCAATAEAVNSPVGQEPARGGDDQSGGVNLEAVRAVRDAALELQAYAVSCHSWAGQVGR